jgi:hypothetical protein
MAAAELHEGVVAARIGLGGDGGGDGARELAVAILVDVFN